MRVEQSFQFILPVQTLSITSSSMKVTALGCRCLYCFFSVGSHRHRFHQHGRHPSSLESPHFPSGRHDASTRLPMTAWPAFTKQLSGWYYYYVLQGNPQPAALNICCLALLCCLGIPCLNEIWRGHAYGSRALIFFSFSFSLLPFFPPSLFPSFFFFKMSIVYLRDFHSFLQLPQYLS